MEAEKASGSYIRSRQVQFQQTSHPLQARSLQDHSQIKENGITLYSTLDKGYVTHFQGGKFEFCKKIGLTPTMVLMLCMAFWASRASLRL